MACAGPAHKLGHIARAVRFHRTVGSDGIADDAVGLLELARNFPDLAAVGKLVEMVVGRKVDRLAAAAGGNLTELVRIR